MRRAFLLALALCSTACERELVEPELIPLEQEGTLRVALTTTGSDGASYVLRDSTLEISGSALITLSGRGATADALTTPLPAGVYTLFLRPGYRVLKLSEDGQEHAVDARLVGSNPLRFTVHPLEDATLALTFASGDERVSFGTRPVLSMRAH